MALKIIGVGVGRTGTYSLKLAVNELGFGPCHHMEEVLHQMAVQTPLWMEAVAGRPNWEAIYRGYESAVDWPTAGFFRELYAANPTAKFILTHRSPDSWSASFSETIYRLLVGKSEAPKEMHAWLEMAAAVIEKTGFPSGLDVSGLKHAFIAHNEAVKASIPPDQLLVYEVKEGWESLCAFLGVRQPTIPFPRTNDRAEFWDRVSGKK
ncbi:MAG: sulfotransferase family protein [Hyphomonadaceae bacterium]